MSSELKVYASPERYVQGRNATDHLGSQMKKLSMKGPVVVVTSATPKRLLEDRWTKSLHDHHYEFTTLDFGGTATIVEAERIANEVLRTRAKTLVAFGGGQTIDTAHFAVNLVGDGHNLEFISCPTVASTNAPSSAVCVMYHENQTYDGYRIARRHPSLVLVDTTAISQSPPRMLVSGLGDAVATWFEARSIREAGSKNFLGGLPTETSTALSKLCLDIILRDGPAAVQSVEARAVTPALERVVEANTLLSGIGFESGGLSVAHSLLNGFTSQPQCSEYTHGEKLAFGLLVQLVLEGRPQDEITQILTFNTSVGLPVTLNGVGVDSNDIKALQEIAERALAPKESAHNEPFEVTVNMLVDAIRVADLSGVNFLERKL